MADSISQSQDVNSDPPSSPAKLPEGWLSRWPWITFVLPMLVFMLMTSLEPTPSPQLVSEKATQENSEGLAVEQILDDLKEELPLEEDSFFQPNPNGGLLPAVSYSYYPHVYTAKIVVTSLAMLLVLPGYWTFPLRVSWLGVVVGVIGIFVWVGLCELSWERKVLAPIDESLGRLVSYLPGLDGAETPSVGLMSLLGSGTRSAFNPLKQLADNPAWAYSFLAIRFFGLVVLVPIFEEFLYRGFLMRYVVHPNWWQVPFGEVNRTAVLVGTFLPALLHPAEFFAAVAWFGMITWLMIRTRNIWDCVVAHAVTNLLLGLYVVWFDQWHLM